MLDDRLRAFRRAAPWMLLVGLAGLAALGALSWHAPPGRQPDHALLAAVRLDRRTWLYNQAAAVSRWGEAQNVAGLALAVGLFAWARLGRAAAAWLPVTAAVVAGLGELAVKPIVGRMPPPLPDGRPVVGLESFPSGHTAGVGAVLAAFLLVVAARPPRSPRWRSAAVGIAVGMAVVLAWARCAEGAHWPTDTVAGYLVGGVAAVTAAAVISASSARHRRVGRPSPAPFGEVDVVVAGAAEPGRELFEGA